MSGVWCQVGASQIGASSARCQEKFYDLFSGRLDGSWASLLSIAIVILTIAKLLWLGVTSCKTFNNEDR